MSTTAAQTLAGQRVSTAGVVFFTASAATPLTVCAAIVTTGLAATGKLGLPLAFVIIAAVLAVFSVGYVAMARQVPNAGAFYTYVSLGLGRPAGVGASWVALLAYNALQIGLYGAIGPTMADLLRDWFAVDVPWWVIAIVAWAVVAFLGLRRIKHSARVLLVLLAAEVALVLLYSVANLANPADGGPTLDGLALGDLLGSALGPLLGLAVLGFVGFEQSAVFSEQASPSSVRRATIICIGGLCALYAISSWSTIQAAGPDTVVADAQSSPTAVLFALAEQNLGSWAAGAGRVLLVTSVLAALISFHATCARYTFALGRDHVLPAAFGRTAPRTGQPGPASISQSALALVVIIAFAIGGWDPVTKLFFIGGTAGALGVLLLLSATAFATVRYLREHEVENSFLRKLAPPVAAIAVTAILVLVVANYALLLGVPEDSPLRWGIPIAFALVALGGVVYGIVLRRNRPQVYDTIGKSQARTPVNAR
ncbi:APC family permease [Actinokineospora globicatena]|uniref:APC family permease n=1 Tax=Actinokineospora globicatena TaxID=103729 RepID=UPI0020A505DA|nr:APC family permease [Actinokineospora globicatena]MCP2303895.1 Amino acid transporter [Actinokineospora globicatena]GLW86642.1 amino acid permease [Actinokineospora globicatena]